MEPRIRTDSGIYVEGEGYERVVMVDNWDDRDPTRIAQFTIRVDRTPLRSKANIDTRVHGEWVPAGNIPPYMWWYDMPGYTRAGQRRTDSATMELVDKMSATLQDLCTFNGV